MSELAARIDVSTGSIGNWENAPPEKPMIPEAPTLAKLAAMFEVSLSYLLYGEIGESEGSGNLEEVARWKDRALTAERERDALKTVLKSAAGVLAEAAGETVSLEGKPKPKASSSASDEIASAVAEVASGSKGRHVLKAPHHGAKSK